jgi:hypothetical protein
VLHAQQRTEHVGVECDGKALGCLLGDRSRLALSAGIVDRDVETPEAPDRSVDETADVILVPHVGLDKFGLGAERAEFADQCLSGILPTTGNDNPVARFRERDGGRAAYAREGSSDQYDRRGQDYLLEVSRDESPVAAALLLTVA